MADEPHSLEEIEELLSTKPAIPSGEPQRVMLDLARHLLRQQREHAQLQAEIQRIKKDMLTPAKLAEHQKRFG